MCMCLFAYVRIRVPGTFIMIVIASHELYVAIPALKAL